MNVITVEVMDEMDRIIDTVAGDAAIKGCVITSGKDSFSGGADLTMLQASAGEYAKLMKTKGEEAANQFLLDSSARLTKIYRRLETCGKPFAAAIHGTCLGGAFELSLSCQFRVVSDDAKTRVGLPEIKVGLFPGAGGTQRVARLMPTGDALQMLFKGEQIKAATAKAMNLVHAVAPRDQIVALAKDGSRPTRTRRRLGHGGLESPLGPVHSPAGMQIWPPPAPSRGARPWTTTRRPRHPLLGLRGADAADGPRPACREPLLRQDPALEGKRR